MDFKKSSMDCDRGETLISAGGMSKKVRSFLHLRIKATSGLGSGWTNPGYYYPEVGS